jgi:hypothetical protein
MQGETPFAHCGTSAKMTSLASYPRSLSRVWESEAGISRGAFGQRCGEHAGRDVVVVVHFRNSLAWIGPQYTPGVLHEPSFERDRCCQE